MADPSAVAATTATAATTVSQQATQSALVSLLADPIDNAFQLLDPAQPSSWDTFIAAITALIHHFGLVSGTQAANYYEAERKAAGIPGTFTVRVAPTAAADKIDTGMRWATKDLWQPNPDLGSILSLVTGVAEKDILDTGRDTILQAVQSDRKSKGWARETEPGCCSFCAMLAVRGATYRSESSAGFQAHSNCRCFVLPIFTSFEPSAQVRGWQSLYQSSTQGVRGGAAMRNAFRKAYEAQQPPA